MASSVNGVVMALVLGIGIFTGFFLFWTDQLEQNGMQMPDEYNDSYNQLIEVQKDMDDRVNDIKTSVDKVQESSSGILAAINGFKGAGQALLLTLGFTSDSVQATQSIMATANIIPPWVFNLLMIALVSFIIFVVLDLIIGRKGASA